MPKDVPQNKRTALKIAAVYAVAGGLWILLSDGLLGMLFTDVQTLIKISTFKGWVFVVITAWLLYVLIQRDIRLIQSSEKALKESVARLEDEKAKSDAILAAVGDGICIIAPDYRILYENAAHQQSLGSHISEYCYKAYALVDTVCEGCPARMTFGDGGTHRAERSLTLDGRSKYFETTASPLKDAHGNTVAVIEAVRETTARKKIENDLMRSKKLESIGILARGLSHDFNNILTAILGNISLAKISLTPDDNTFALLTKAEDACLRAEELIRQLHSVAKISESDKKTLSISSVAKEASDSALQGSRIECTYHFPDNLRPVTVDEDQISQAIYNIVINACDSMNAGGHITLGAENVIIDHDDSPWLGRGDYIKLSIADEGAGIEKELLPKIFDPYFTTKKLGSRKATGFSLTASYFAVKNHEGYIFVDSTVGKGTTFSIYLPAA